jgi:hypothetical protein
MNKPQAMIAQGKTWRYIGPGPGHDEVHLILFVERTQKGTAIIYSGTKIVPPQQDESRGHSWMGPYDEFVRVFTFVQ